MKLNPWGLAGFSISVPVAPQFIAASPNTHQYIYIHNIDIYDIDIYIHIFVYLYTPMAYLPESHLFVNNFYPQS